LNDPININDDFPDISNELISSINEIHSIIYDMKGTMKENESYGISSKKELSSYNDILYKNMKEHEVHLNKQKMKIKLNQSKSKHFIENIQDNFVFESNLSCIFSIKCLLFD
jgi:hypothetical protein